PVWRSTRQTGVRHGSRARASLIFPIHHCIGYLDHPFKNKPFETEKHRHSLLANGGGLVYTQTSSTAYSYSNSDTSRDGEAFSMAGVFILLLRLLDDCLDALFSRFARWTKPLRTSLPLATLTDLGKSKSQLFAENALLRQQLIVLRRKVN